MSGPVTKVLTVASQKGGSGKSAIAVHLAVEAMRACTTGKVVLFDTDPQASAFDWARDRSDRNLVVLRVHANDLLDRVRQAREEDFGLCIIDTPPHAEHSIDTAIRLADLVLVPCCTGRLNRLATAATVDMLDIAGRHGAFVLNRTPARGAGADETQARLNEQHADMPVLATRLGQRIAFERAVDAGLGVREFCRPLDKARLEMAALHDEIFGLL